jgi:hypothetical protein
MNRQPKPSVEKVHLDRHPDAPAGTVMSGDADEEIGASGAKKEAPAPMTDHPAAQGTEQASGKPAKGSDAPDGVGMPPASAPAGEKPAGVP